MLHKIIGIGYVCRATTALAADPPSKQIASGQLKLTVLLPDAKEGYYRGTRFDWSGQVWSAECNGHAIFGEWRLPHDPLNHDGAVGPADEFDIETPTGYDLARVGESFMKVGVGMLKRKKEEPYHFWERYEIVNPGIWVTTSGKDWIEFRHDLDGGNGWKYRYTKRIEIHKKSSSFAIRRKLENLGTRPLQLEHYNHNFIRFDEDRIGRNYRLVLPFDATIKSVDPKETVFEVGRRAVRFHEDVPENKGYLVELTGFGKEIGQNRFDVEDVKRNVRLRVVGDRPLIRFKVYTEATALCPEPFVLIHVEPGKTTSWISDYTFGLLKKVS